MGHCLWWWLGKWGSYGGLQTIGIHYHWYAYLCMWITFFLFFYKYLSQHIIGATALTGVSVPIGSGPIWLDDLGCTGSERTLASCGTPIFGNHNCIHSEDAGVRCTAFGISEWSVTVERALSKCGNHCYNNYAVCWYPSAPRVQRSCLLDCHRTLPLCSA